MAKDTLSAVFAKRYDPTIKSGSCMVVPPKSVVLTKITAPDDRQTLCPPSKATLRKYGLESEDWCAMAHRQSLVCAVCKKLPTSGRLNVDHEHVNGWKKMTPEYRKRFVRGLLCYFCNRSYLARGMTIAKSKNVTKYLEDYERRR